MKLRVNAVFGSTELRGGPAAIVTSSFAEQQ
jgi:hypothetical protein